MVFIKKLISLIFPVVFRNGIRGSVRVTDLEGAESFAIASDRGQQYVTRKVKSYRLMASRVMAGKRELLFKEMRSGKSLWVDESIADEFLVRIPMNLVDRTEIKI